MWDIMFQLIIHKWFKNAIYKVLKFIDMRKDFTCLDNFKLKIISSTNTDNKVHNYMIITTLK